MKDITSTFIYLLDRFAGDPDRTRLDVRLFNLAVYSGVLFLLLGLLFNIIIFHIPFVSILLFLLAVIHLVLIFTSRNREKIFFSFNYTNNFSFIFISSINMAINWRPVWWQSSLLCKHYFFELRSFYRK
jgi:hypothetical protein